VPDRKYFNKISSETRFRIGELEKLYRLMILLSEINRSTLRDSVIVRGGTAINLCYQQLPRLSVDIDLAYSRNGSKELMQRGREEVRQKLTKIFKDEDYEYAPYLNEYALDRFELRYKNASGSPDKIKVEVNYIACRIPVYGVVNVKPYNIFDISLENLRTLVMEELYGSKIEALLKRAKPRDFYDVNQLAYDYKNARKSIDIDKLRRCTIFSCCVEIPSDFRPMLKNNPADKVNDEDVVNELTPTLRSDKPFDIGMAKHQVGSFSSNLFKLSTEQEKFIDRFFELEYKPELLFPDTEHIARHPGIMWRLQQMSKSTR